MVLDAVQFMGSIKRSKEIFEMIRRRAVETLGSPWSMNEIIDAIKDAHDIDLQHDDESHDLHLELFSYFNNEQGAFILSHALTGIVDTGALCGTQPDGSVVCEHKKRLNGAQIVLFDADSPFSFSIDWALYQYAQPTFMGGELQVFGWKSTWVRNVQPHSPERMLCLGSHDG